MALNISTSSDTRSFYKVRLQIESSENGFKSLIESRIISMHCLPAVVGPKFIEQRIYVAHATYPYIIVLLAIGIRDTAVSRNPRKSTSVINGTFTDSSVASPEVRMRASDRSSCPAEKREYEFKLVFGCYYVPAFIAKASLHIVYPYIWKPGLYWVSIANWTE